MTSDTWRDAAQHRIWKALLARAADVGWGDPDRAADARAATDAITDLIQPPDPLTRRPALMRDLHEHIRWADWHHPHLLADALRRHADRLDRHRT